MRFKVNIYSLNADRFQEVQETRQLAKIKNIFEDVKKFLRLENSKNIKKTSNGTINFLDDKGEIKATFSKSQIEKLEKKLNLPKYERVLKKLNSFNIDLNFLLDALNISDRNIDVILLSFEKVEKILDKINGKNGYIKDILNGKSKTDISNSILYTIFFSLENSGNSIESIVNLINIYDNDFFTKENKKIESSIFANFQVDIVNPYLGNRLYEKEDISTIKKIKIEQTDTQKDLGDSISFYNQLYNKGYFFVPEEIIDFNENIKNFYYKYFGFGDGLEDVDNIDSLVKKGNKLSVNELISLDLILSNKKEHIKGAYGKEYENYIKKLLGKFDFKNEKELKLKLYDFGYLDLDNNMKEVFLKLSFKQTKFLCEKIGKYIKEPKDILKQDILSSLDLFSDADKQQILGYLNKELKNKGKKVIDENEVNESYDKRIDDLFLIQNGIDSKKITPKFIFEKLLSTLKGKFGVSENSLKTKIDDIFSESGIVKLKEAFGKANKGGLEFLVDYLFEQKHFSEAIWEENKDGNKRKLSKKSKYDITKYILGIIKDQIKGSHILETKKMMDTNKEFKEIIDKDSKKVFKGYDGIEKVKKDLAIANLKFDIGNILIKNNTNILTKDLLIQNKDTILSSLKKQFGVKVDIDKGFKETQDINKYFSQTSKLLNLIISDIPSSGIRFNYKEIKKLNEEEKIIKKMGKEYELYNKLGYVGYMEYLQQIEAEKIKLTAQGVDTSIVDINKSPFKNEEKANLNLKLEEHNGIYTVWLKVPGNDKVCKIDSLHIEDANKEAISQFFKLKYDFPFVIKGSGDILNKLISQNTDISKDVLTEDDFNHILIKSQNIIYENFFGRNATKKEKSFLKDNHLQDPYILYKHPDTFLSSFFEAIKKQSSIGGIQMDLKKYVINLDTINPNLFDYNLAKKRKEIILDNGKNTGLFTELKNKIGKIFN